MFCGTIFRIACHASRACWRRLCCRRPSLIQRAGLLDESLPLRRERDGAIEMRQRGVEIPGGPRDARGKQPGRRIAGPFCQTGLDMAARGLDLALRKQHGGQEMAEHGIAGRMAKALLAEPARLVTAARH